MGITPGEGAGKKRSLKNNGEEGGDLSIKEGEEVGHIVRQNTSRPISTIIWGKGTLFDRASRRRKVRVGSLAQRGRSLAIGELRGRDRYQSRL